MDFLKYVDELKKKENLKNVKAVTVDGFGGGTGMSPWLIMNETCLPSAVIMKKPLKADYDLLLAGGYVNGMDVAKAMMLGAKGVAMGRAMLIAANNAEKNGQGIKNFVEATAEEVKMIAATQRVNHTDKIIGRRKNLLALSEDAAEMFGLPTDPLTQI
ncbi:alpha-hydroxy-acid oxidizing protein [archaeon]|nr:alpha-hydroxy-acid oxidizing protein [archaeon]